MADICLRLRLLQPGVPVASAAGAAAAAHHCLRRGGCPGQGRWHWCAREWTVSLVSVVAEALESHSRICVPLCSPVMATPLMFHSYSDLLMQQRFWFQRHPELLLLLMQGWIRISTLAEA